MKPYLVEVEWIDSAFHRGWSDADTKRKEMSYSVCRTAGFLIARDKKCLKLAMNSGDNHQSFGDGITIPTVAVKRVRRLK